MNILYLGKYSDRFKTLIEKIRPDEKQILELCFGDIKIAEYCKTQGKGWTGFDINKEFIHFAQQKGFHASYRDISTSPEFPKADLCIMVGSLYHFHEEVDDLFEKIFSSCDRLLLSEPITNLSSNKGLLGFIARKSANAGKGKEQFRYNKASFLNILDELCMRKNLIYKVLEIKRDILVSIDKQGSTK
jgi:hypothetical protein